MSDIVEVRLPKYPDCWESCGNCAAGEVFIQSLLVSPGDIIERDDTLLVLETGKVALDIPSPYRGRVLEVLVAEYDPVDEFALILRLEVLPES